MWVFEKCCCKTRTCGDLLCAGCLEANHVPKLWDKNVFQAKGAMKVAKSARPEGSSLPDSEFVAPQT